MVSIFTGSGSGLQRGSGNLLGTMGLLGSASFGRSGEQLFFNAANGNLLITRTDEFLVGRGPDIAIDRTYNSLGNLSDDNADNWRQSTDRRILGLTGTVNTAGSTVTRRGGDGTEIVYSWNGSAYAGTDGVTAYTLTYSSGTGNWTWTHGDTRTTETYSAYGTGEWRIVGQTDANGNALAFTYIGANLDKVTSADGSYEQYSWSGSNLTQIVTGYIDLVTSTAKTLTRTRYTYDASNRLSTVIADLSPGDNSIADGATYTATYTYDGTSKRVASIAESDGSYMQIAYDGSGRVATLTQTAVTGVTRVTTIAYTAGSTSITDAKGQVTTLEYNADGTLKKVTLPPAYSGATAQTIQFGYTAGDLTIVTDALGKVTTYGGYIDHKWTTSTDPLGNVVTRTYDANDQLTSETRTGSDRNSSAAAHTVRNVYDSASNLIWTISADGLVTHYDYTSGQLTRVTQYPWYFYDVSALSPTTMVTAAQLDSWALAQPDKTSRIIETIVRDARGNVTSDTRNADADSSGAVLNAAGYSISSTVYDQSGRLLQRWTGNDNHETFVYDGLGRLTASTDLNGGTTNIVFTDSTADNGTRTVVTLANGYVRTTIFDKAGEVVSVADSGSYVTGGTTSYLYDKLGRARVTTDANNNKSYALYDSAGRKTADIDAAGRITEYRYDAGNHVVASIRWTNTVSGTNLTALVNPDNTLDIATIRPASDTADIWNWMVYDADGRVAETIDGDGSATGYEYDGSGRLVKTTQYFNQLTASLATFKTTAPATVTLPTAHANDRYTRTFYTKDGAVGGTLDGEGYLTGITYDYAGRKFADKAFLGQVDPSLRAAGTFSAVTTSAAAGGAAIARYIYDGENHLRFVIDANTNVTEYVYNDGVGQGTDSSGVRQTIRYAGTLGTPASFTLDGIKAAIVTAGLAANPANRSSFIVYDAARRAAYSIDAAGAVTAFTYDSMGQVTKTVQFATKRATASLPTLVTMNSWAATNAGAADRVSRSYYTARGELAYSVDAEGYVTGNAYDANGQLTQATRWETAVVATDAWTIATVAATVSGAYAANTFTYDALGRVATMRDGEGHGHDYSYYGNGMLAWDIQLAGAAEETRTKFAYDGAGRVTDRYDGWTAAGPNPATHYSYDGLGNRTGQTDTNGHTTTSTFDKVGRVLTETDALGGVVTRQYNALGDVVKRTDARGNSSYYYYDSLGRVISARDAEDYVTETAYTAFGEVASVTRRANRATNTAAVGTLPVYTADAARDETASFEYDQLGRLTKSTDALGNFESYALDAFGKRTSVTDKLGLVTTNTYDRRGQLIQDSRTIGANYGVAGTTSSTVVNKYAYDARGNRISMIEAYGATEARTTLFFYDRANRLIERRGMAITVGMTSATVTPSTYYAYDGLGNLIRTIDPTGARTFDWYDKLNRKIGELVETDSAAGTGSYTTFAYDAVGNLTTTRLYGTSVAFPGSPGGSPPAAPSGEYRETVRTFDAINRLLTSSASAQTIGYWNGTSYVKTSGALTTSYQYDAGGNIVLLTDPAGAQTFNYFDKLNRKTAQVDAETYLTAWTLDDDGNVTVERRYATQAATTITVAAPPTLSTTADDRVTNFTYDKLGRRKTEERTGIAAYTIDSSSGAIAANAVTSSLVQYSYNALGQVTQKIEATGDTIDYTYDASGRLIMEMRAGFVQYSGGSAVRPTVRYYYDRLGDVTSTRQGQDIAGGTDRVATSSYDYAHGARLDSTTDAAGGVRHYLYDAAGRKIAETYDRLVYSVAGSTTVTEAIVYRFDAAGRTITQSNARWNGSAWVYTDSAGGYYDAVRFAYNAYGQIIGTGVTAGPDAAAAYQETYDYDTAGRVWRSNSGDGVLRYHIYDAAGHETLTLASTGADLATLGLTLANYTASITSTGGTSIANAVTTVTVYDKRGQTAGTRQPDRQLSTAVTQALVEARSYNAFGEVLTQTDATGAVTSYTYTNLGRVALKVSPQVSVTAADGSKSNVTPTDRYYYDISGRLVGVEDANSVQAVGGGALSSRVITKRLLLAGTGYGGSDSIVLKEFHPDTGVYETRYDVFGDARVLINEISVVETRDYDALSRLTVQYHPTRAAGSPGNPGGTPVQLIDYYSYDVLGNRIGHWNSQFGASYLERTGYDAKGRVTAEIDYMGTAVTYAYAWSTSIAATGLTSAPAGGWTKTTVNKAGLSETEKDDYFGRRVDLVDFGAHNYDMTFDLAGRLVAQSNSSGESVTYTYYNTGTLKSQVFDGTTGTYEYDAAGRRTKETFGTLQNAAVTYDAMGRMASWTDTPSGLTTSSTVYEYDAVGNTRLTRLTYSAGTIDYWYRYDNMNRFTVAMGTLVGAGGVTGDAARGTGVISRGVNGWDVTWNAASQRMTETTTLVISVPNVIGSWGGPGGGGPIFGPPTIYNCDFRYYYTYTADDYLAATYFANGIPSNIYAPATPAGLTPRDSYVRDALGRVITSGTTTSTYNMRSEVVSQVSGGTTTTFDYGLETSPGSNVWTGAYQGVLTHTKAVTSGQSDQNTKLTYDWWQDAKQKTLSVTINTTNTTTYAYDVSGRLSTANVNGTLVTYTSDAQGMVVSRAMPTYTTDRYYRFNGREIGYTSNQTITSTPSGSRNVDFDQAYTPVVGSADTAGRNSNYTVETGDTLRIIAQKIWGDAALWYKIAAANGLNGEETLAVGRVLVIPQGVTSTHNTSSTFQPYDPNKAMGDTYPGNGYEAPVQPQPPAAKRNKCGIFGQILLAAIAIAITVALPGGGTVIGAAINGMIGSAVSQVVGIATGIQDKFNFGAVAMAGIGAGIGVGVSNAFSGVSILGSKLATDVVTGMVSNALTQGIGVITGLQKKFDFVGVAVAGVVSGVGGAVSRALPGHAETLLDGAINPASHLNQFAASAVSGIAGAATRSVLTGTDFGDNILAVLPDVIGSALGRMAADGITGQGRMSKAEVEAYNANVEAKQRALALAIEAHEARHAAAATQNAADSTTDAIGADQATVAAAAPPAAIAVAPAATSETTYRAGDTIPVSDGGRIDVGVLDPTAAGVTITIRYTGPDASTDWVQIVTRTNDDRNGLVTFVDGPASPFPYYFKDSDYNLPKIKHTDASGNTVLLFGDNPHRIFNDTHATVPNVEWHGELSLMHVTSAGVREPLITLTYSYTSSATAAISYQPIRVVTPSTMMTTTIANSLPRTPPPPAPAPAPAPTTVAPVAAPTTAAPTPVTPTPVPAPSH